MNRTIRRPIGLYIQSLINLYLKIKNSFIEKVTNFDLISKKIKLSFQLHV